MSFKLGLLNLFENPEGLSEHEMVKRQMEVMVEAEDLGFDSLWPAEHHFSEYGYLGAPQVSLAAVAARTKRIRLGTGVVVLPFHNPIRIAEDFALLDLMSDGRVSLGVGRGYQPIEYKGFGLDQANSRQMFEEALDIVKLAWTQEAFSYHGRFYKFDDISVRPKPLQQPHPPIYAAAISPDSFERIGRMGHNLLASAIFGSSPEQIKAGIDNYKRGRKEAGLDPEGGQIACLLMIYPARHMDDAINDFREPIAWFYKTIAKYVAPPAGQELVKGYELYGKSRDFAMRLSFDKLREGISVICGDVDHCTEKLAAIQTEFGFNEMLCWTNVGKLERSKSMKALELIGTDLIPRVRRLADAA